MQEGSDPASISDELLRRLGSPPERGPGAEAEAAFQRAREALAQALQEAHRMQLEARDSARSLRERELTALMQTLRAMRDSVEAQIEARRRAAEVEAQMTLQRARDEARAIVEQARGEAAALRDEAAALRAGAEERAREVERLEADFDAAVSRLLKRLGVEATKETRAAFRRAGRK